MKQILLSIFFSALVVSVHGQMVTKGNKLLGGNFYVRVNSAQQSNSGNIGMIPSFGWVIGTNKVVGIKGGINYSRSSFKSNQSDVKACSFGISPAIFLKKYKMLAENLGFFFEHELNGMYLWSKQNFPGPDYAKTRAWGIGYAFNPGVVYKLSKKFLGEATIGGADIAYSDQPGANSVNIAMSFLQYFGIGINYIIGAKDFQR